MSQRNKIGLFANRRLVVALILLGALIVCSAITYRHYRTVAPKSTQAGNSTINLSPATKQEIQDSNQHKEDSAKAPDTPPAGTKKTVTPTIVDASQYGQTIEVRSFVPSIVEANGTCIVTFSNGSDSFTKQEAAQQDATTTLCPKISVPRSSFANPGTWEVKITYNSATSQGSSTTIEMKVE